MIYLADQFLAVEYDTRNPTVVTDGPTISTNRNHCDGGGWITRDTFLPHMQWKTLKVRTSTGKVLSNSTQLLPFALEELGCETASLNPYAYIWDCLDNCVLSVLRTENFNMVKQGKNFYVISGFNSTTTFVFKVENNPQNYCGRLTDIYPSNYDALNLAIISRGFHLRSGSNLGKKKNGATHLLQCIAPTENNGFARFYAWDQPHLSHRTSDEDMYLNKDYKKAHGTKIGQPLLPQLTNAPSFWNKTLEKPMCARTNTDPYYSDAVSWKPTSLRIHANCGKCFWKLMAAYPGCITAH